MVKLILVDDPRARAWSPFAETRPVGELRFGALLLRERVERWWGTPCAGYLMADDGGPTPLYGFDEPGVPPVLGEDARVRDGTLVWLSRAAPSLAVSPPELPPGEARVFTMENTVVGVWIPSAGSGVPPVPVGPGEALPDGVPGVPVGGRLLAWPWHLVDANGSALGEDLAILHPGSDLPSLEGVHRIGDGGVSLGAGAQVGPGVILDTRDGPIRLDEGVMVEGPARLAGPLHLGPGSVVYGGHLSRLSAGPVCKLRGEVDTAVLLGFVNKAHDGYLGHALLGRWVNLGALTTNSDLKNDYGPVRVELPAGTVDTGLMKVGVFLGDHVKTGIGTVLNTGTVVGAGTNVFGGGMPPKSLPPFSWAGGGSVTTYRWEKFLEVARVVTARRDQRWTPGVEAVLKRLWEATHGRSP